MTNSIQPISKTETIFFGNTIIENFWIPKSNMTNSQRDNRDAILQILDNIHTGFACIYSENITDEKIIQCIFKLSEKVRFYILVNDYSKELDKIRGKALIRYKGLQNIGSFVLANPNSKASAGVFFGGQLTEGSLLLDHFCFEVGAEETNKLFQHFCYQFWKNAKSEIVDIEEKQVDVEPVVIYYENDKFKGKDFVYGTLFDFIEKRERRELSGVRIGFQNQEKKLPSKIQDITERELDDFLIKELISKDEFEKRRPEFKDDGESVSIRYIWKNVPFYLPAKAKEHNIYSQWNDEKKKITEKLNDLEKDIESIKTRKYSKKITRIIMGKNVILDGLKKQIDDLKEVDFSNTERAKRDSNISLINSICTQIEGLRKDIDKENRQAKIDEMIEEEEENLNKKNRELDALPVPQDEKFKGKYEDDRKKIEKEIRNLQNNINSLKKNREKVANENNETETSSLELHKRDKPSSNKTKFSIQDLRQLPQIGKLFSDNGISYLAIDSWDDFERAKSEANRLDAKLCANI